MERLPEEICAQIFAKLPYLKQCQTLRVCKRWQRIVYRLLSTLYTELIVETATNNGHENTFSVKCLTALSRITVTYCSKSKLSIGYMKTILDRHRKHVTSLTCECSFLIEALEMEALNNEILFCKLEQCWLIILPNNQLEVAILRRSVIQRHLNLVTFQIHTKPGENNFPASALEELASGSDDIKVTIEMHADNAATIACHLNRVSRGVSVLKLKLVCNDMTRNVLDLSALAQLLNRKHIRVKQLCLREWNLEIKAEPWNNDSLISLRLSCCDVENTAQFCDAFKRSKLQVLELAGHCHFHDLQYIEGRAHLEFVHLMALANGTITIDHSALIAG